MKLTNLSKILIGSNLLLILFCVLSFRACKTKENVLSANKIILEEYKNENQSFKNLIGINQEKIALQEQIIIENSKEVQRLLTENSKLNKINSQIKLDFTNKVSDVLVHYVSDTVFIRDTFNNVIAIKVDSKFDKRDLWYSISGKIGESGLELDSITFKNRLTVNIGESREGWFKPLKTNVEVINENPYTNYNAVNNLTVKKKDKLINKPWFTYLIGIGSGVVITSLFLIK